jgi:hypothetical protein
MTRAYSPRAFAPLAMDHFANVPRCALFAKPGMGKSVLTLTHLDHLHNVWGEDRPTLVLGPKRVAESVWTDEQAKWHHLRGLEVVSVTGDAATRAAALKRDVQVHVMNYENLPWLAKQYTRGRRAWPWSTVVADESTKLKNFRLRQGGVRGQALSEFAHKDVERWINLTGTPSPNGLRDLWGQTWYLDAGERLGHSFAAFEERYFAWRRVKDALSHKPGLVQQILPYAHELIHEKLADLCLTLDPKDWFTLEEPVHNVIEVDLPPSARSQYRELEREMFMRLKTGEEVEVFNAAALTLKCLQMANGAVYLEDGVTWRETHTEKLDALEDLSDETGEPILVVYHFKHDLARLQARFPDGLNLKTPEGMAAAKRGEGRLWFGQPGSMGHGVDGLQEHCRTVAVFGHWWDLEQYDQILERVGAMRQYQADKTEPTFIHQIVARGTVDEVVTARRTSKRAVQDLLMDYMKGKQ